MSDDAKVGILIGTIAMLFIAAMFIFTYRQDKHCFPWAEKVKVNQMWIIDNPNPFEEKDKVVVLDAKCGYVKFKGVDADILSATSEKESRFRGKYIRLEK